MLRCHVELPLPDDLHSICAHHEWVRIPGWRPLRLAQQKSLLCIAHTCRVLPLERGPKAPVLTQPALRRQFEKTADTSEEYNQFSSQNTHAATTNDDGCAPSRRDTGATCMRQIVHMQGGHLRRRCLGSLALQERTALHVLCRGAVLCRRAAGRKRPQHGGKAGHLLRWRC